MTLIMCVLNDQNKNSNIKVCLGESVDIYDTSGQQKYQRDSVFSLDIALLLFRQPWK